MYHISFKDELLDSIWRSVMGISSFPPLQGEAEVDTFYPLSALNSNLKRLGVNSQRCEHCPELHEDTHVRFLQHVSQQRVVRIVSWKHPSDLRVDFHSAQNCSEHCKPKCVPAEFKKRRREEETLKNLNQNWPLRPLKRWLCYIKAK